MVKWLLVFFILMIPGLAKAKEFNFAPRYSLGLGFVEEKEVPHYRYHSEIIGTVHFFNNEHLNDKLSVNLLGLGLSHNSESETYIVFSPLSMAYNRHISISYNLHLEKLNYGFSLNYQF